MPTIASEHARPAMRAAVARAGHAPSLLDTEPWRLALTGNAMTMSRAPGRRLPVIDPQGRQAMLSCGAALLNARVSFARAGLVPVIERFPDGLDAPVFARLRIRRPEGPDELTEDHALSPLEPWIEHVQRESLRTVEAQLDRAVLARLAAVAATEDSVLVQVARPDERLRVEELHRRARRMAHADAAYQAELRLWSEVTDQDDSPMGRGVLPAQRRGGSPGSLLVIGTGGDEPAAWLRAGEAVQRVRLELARRGYATRSLTEVLTVPAARTGLRRGLGLHFHPQAIFRIGQLPAGLPKPRLAVDDEEPEEDLG